MSNNLNSADLFSESLQDEPIEPLLDHEELLAEALPDSSLLIHFREPGWSWIAVFTGYKKR